MTFLSSPYFELKDFVGLVEDHMDAPWSVRGFEAGSDEKIKDQIFSQDIFTNLWVFKYLSDDIDGCEILGGKGHYEGKDGRFFQ